MSISLVHHYSKCLVTIASSKRCSCAELSRQTIKHISVQRVSNEIETDHAASNANIVVHKAKAHEDKAA